MQFTRKLVPAIVGGLILSTACSVSLAEVKTINIAQQYGISYLPLLVMKDQQLLKKQAKKEGLGDVEVNWARFAGGNVMNDAILSGDLHFASGGVGPFVTLWAKTKGNMNVKGVTAMNAMPLMLTTRNPNVKTLKDFTEKDRIALPAVKVSIQAITLQMAAEQTFGKGQQNKLDALTVTQSHPDGMAALLSGSSEINSHFTSPPYQYIELKDPRVHMVLNSYDVTGGPHTFNIVWATQKFADQNPKTYKAFVEAFNQAIDFINKDPRAAAQLYVDVTKQKEPVEFYLDILKSPDVEFTTTPKNVMKFVDFMYSIKFIQKKPDSWKDLFFPNMHDKAGS
ncbi:MULTISPECIES: ABC transporter substrate-binding protein [unclassified Castellaniella]|uniref:ABC transporter substrate-binding protein n=1 Tax=unclassified Castellaniella TaxID=2617606 RepID=UPI003315E494